MLACLLAASGAGGLLVLSLLPPPPSLSVALASFSLCPHVALSPTTIREYKRTFPSSPPPPPRVPSSSLACGVAAPLSLDISIARYSECVCTCVCAYEMVRGEAMGCC